MSTGTGCSLPKNVLTILHSESAGAHTQHMAGIKANKGLTNHIVRASAAKQFDEPSPAQARAVDKVLQLPAIVGAG